MYTDKRLVYHHVRSSDTNRQCTLLSDEGAFRPYVSIAADYHPKYRRWVVMALLLPPVGFLGYVYFSLSPNALDHALGRVLLWRSLTLPFITIALFYFVRFLLLLSPPDHFWYW